MVRRAALSLILGALGLLAGCVGVAGLDSEAAVLRQRAQARWEAILAEDWQKVQEFYPKDLRAAQSPERLRNEYTVQAKRERFEIQGVYFPVDQPGKATVVVKQWFDDQGTVAGFAAEAVGVHDEEWEKRDGQWWFLRIR